jgi:hypothetical protein
LAAWLLVVVSINCCLLIRCLVNLCLHDHYLLNQSEFHLAIQTLPLVALVRRYWSCVNEIAVKQLVIVKPRGLKVRRMSPARAGRAQMPESINGKTET